MKRGVSFCRRDMGRVKEVQGGGVESAAFDVEGDWGGTESRGEVEGTASADKAEYARMRGFLGNLEGLVEPVRAGGYYSESRGVGNQAVDVVRGLHLRRP